MQRLWPDEIIRRAQGAVGGIDIAAFTETVAGDGRLHGMIVFMGVDADIVHDAEAEGKQARATPWAVPLEARRWMVP